MVVPLLLCFPPRFPFLESWYGPSFPLLTPSEGTLPRLLSEVFTFSPLWQTPFDCVGVGSSGVPSPRRTLSLDVTGRISPAVRGVRVPG